MKTFSFQRIGEYKVSDQAKTISPRDYKDATDLILRGGQSNAMVQVVDQQKLMGGVHYVPILPQQLQPLTGGVHGRSPKQSSGDGSKPLNAEYLFADWLGNGGNWSPFIKTRIGNGSFYALGRTRRNIK